jgi:UPF0716 protein FxsA
MSAAGRVRRTAPWLAVSVLAVPIVEIVVGILVQDRIGTTATVLLLLAGCAAGLLIIRRVGLAAIRQMRAPGNRAQSLRSAPDAALILLAGFLLAIPGFVTDVAGLLLLLPPVRRVVTAMVARGFWRRWAGAGGRTVVTGEVITEDRVPGRIADEPPRPGGSPRNSSAPGDGLPGDDPTRRRAH